MHISRFVQEERVEVDAVITEAVSTHFPCLTGNLQGKYTFLSPNPSLYDRKPMKTLYFIRISLKN